MSLVLPRHRLCVTGRVISMRGLIASLALLLCLAGVAWAGPNLEPHLRDDPRWTCERMSVDDAVRQGLVKPYSDYCYAGGGIDTRYGGTKQAVGATGIRDMRTDLWPRCASIDTLGKADGTGFGYLNMRVNELGDTISLYQYSHIAAKTGARIDFGGFTSGQDFGHYVQLACSDYDRISPRTVTTSRVFTTNAGTGQTLSFRSPAQIFTTTSDSIVITSHWDFAMEHPGAADSVKLECTRRVSTRKTDPYFLVRYKFKARGAVPETLRYVWADAPNIGQYGTGKCPTGGLNTNNSSYEVGYMLGYGEVQKNHYFTGAEIDPCVFAMLNISNPLATNDVDGDGNDPRDSLADSLFLCLGGDSMPVGIFVAFNPTQTVPVEVAFRDTAEGLFWEWDGDFTTNLDTNIVYGDAYGGAAVGYRTINARTDSLLIATDAWTVVEYAIGRVEFSDDSTPYWPAIPKITFTDGTVLAIPYYRKR